MRTPPYSGHSNTPPEITWTLTCLVYVELGLYNSPRAVSPGYVYCIEILNVYYNYGHLGL